eukprot:6624609-Alexandrium_andersonii.AAC.1
MRHSNPAGLYAPASSAVQPPTPSAPGKLPMAPSPSPPVDQQQRGESNFKGTDSNAQPNADKEFLHYYFYVDQRDFAHAWDF